MSALWKKYESPIRHASGKPIS